jgi:hypothetical protein
MDRDIYPKQFISDTLVHEIGIISRRNPYLGFLLICSGIEFLGKCINTTVSDWNQSGQSETNFVAAINELFPRQYHGLGKDIYTEMRCGLLHALLPGSKIALSEIKNVQGFTVDRDNHPIRKESGQYIFLAEYFYADFVEACEKVIATPFPDSDKMTRPILRVGAVK